MRTKIFASTAIISLALTVGCGPAPTPAPTPTTTPPSSASFEDVQSQVLVNCNSGGCHDDVTASQGLDLSEANAYASIVDVQSSQDIALDLVEPGDAANSYLVKKIEGTGFGQAMPPPGGGLTPQQIQLVKDWINSL